MSEQKSADTLKAEIASAMQQIPIGSRWVHFKNPEHEYKINGFADIESLDQIGVLYESTFEPTNGIVFVRPVEDFFSEKELEDGTKVKRFTRVG